MSPDIDMPDDTAARPIYTSYTCYDINILIRIGHVAGRCRIWMVGDYHFF